MGIGKIFKAMERWREAKATNQKLCSFVDKTMAPFPLVMLTAYLVAAPIVVCVLDVEQWQLAILPPIGFFVILGVAKVVNQIWMEINEEKFQRGTREMFGPDPDMPSRKNVVKTNKIS